jgi:hypothetical protein
MALVNSQLSGRASWNVRVPGGAVRQRRLQQRNPMGGAVLERAYGVLGGSKPRKVNPRSGTGMKQARQALRGARRREGEKPWGRNVTGCGGKQSGFGGSAVLGRR